MQKLLWVALPALAAVTLGQEQNIARLVNRQSSNGNSISPIYAQILQNSNREEYLINVTIGTPGQSLSVTLDTGSSDLWIPSDAFCQQSEGKCDFGSFDPSKSSTYQVVEQGQFNITYAAPGDYDAGDWGSDTVSIAGGTAITNQIIGVASTGYDEHGVMGIGYDKNEASNNLGQNGVYSSTLDSLVSQGIINRKAYSLYLDALNQTIGALVLGGVDTTKYTGPLVALPLQPSLGAENGQVTEFYVVLTGVMFNDAAGNSQTLTPDDYAQNVLLDSGTSNTLLGADVITSLVTGLGGLDDGSSQYVVPCGLANTNASITYTFGGSDGVKVTVPVSEIVNNKDDGECNLDLQGPIGGSCIMGDSFLRSAYAVFDIDNNLAALAQAANDQYSVSSIIPIPTGSSLPGASYTATITGTHLTGDAASATPSVATASIKHSTVVSAGSPTFNVGSAATASSSSGSGGGSGTSGGIAQHRPNGQVALLPVGASIVAGTLFFS